MRSDREINAAAEVLMQFDGIDIDRYPYETYDDTTKRHYRDMACRVLAAADLAGNSPKTE